MSQLGEALVGMANGEGGTVIIGIAPRAGKIQGVRRVEEAIDRVFQAALLSGPPLVLPVPAVIRVGLKKVLWVSVPQGLPHVYSMEGRYLGREGRHTVPISARDLREMLVARGVMQFEARVPPGARMKDLDGEQVSAYVKALNLPGDETEEETLLRRGCLVEEDGTLRPTYAALLLFGRHPQRRLPSANILAARFSGVAFADEYLKQDIGGTLLQQLQQAEQFVRDNLRSVVRLVGLRHKTTPEYPLEAVRELLVNAVAHRDYNVQGDTIHLHIFADRLEVHSPGGLPGPVTLDNLLAARFSRNAVIVQALADLGYVERLGYGLDRVVTVMKQNGLRPPLFEEVAGTFRVTLYGEPFQPATPPEMAAYAELELNPRQEMALGYLATQARITNRAYQELCPDVHPETLRRDLADMVSKGALLKIGDKKATYYILKSASKK